jgi:nucleotide-binding universal stress UspA family protein/predicted transcriptional regulator
MPPTLLVPLDGSELAETALPWATTLARSRGLRLTLARVVPWPTFAFSGAADTYISPEIYDELLSAERGVATEYLEPLGTRLREQGLEVETVVRDGAPTDCLLDLADELGAFAIVMATHGRGGMARLVRGSVAEQILQQATLPVLMVPGRAAQTTAPSQLSRLLVPLDGSPLAERALDAARELAPAGSTVRLVAVVEPAERTVRAPETDVKIVDETATQQIVERTRAYLDNLRTSLGPTPFTVQIEVLCGKAGREILVAADAQAADLIVMATHGRTGTARWWLGSVADEVVRQAEQPVFLVSARALAARAVGAFSVRDLMTRDLMTVRDDEPLSGALRKLLRRRISGAPVVDSDGKLVGVLSEYDLLRWQEATMKALAKQPGVESVEYGRRLETVAVRDVMSHRPLTIEASASLAAALHVLLEHRVRRLPVVDQGVLVGVLARADVLKAMAEQWAETAASAAVD